MTNAVNLDTADGLSHRQRVVILLRAAAHKSRNVGANATAQLLDEAALVIEERQAELSLEEADHG